MTARNKRRTEGDSERTDETPDAVNDDTLDDFQRAKLAFGKGEDLIRVKFAIVAPDGGEKHLETLEYDPEVHTEDFIRARYGPGKYRLRFLGKDWRFRMMFSCDLAPLPADRSGSTSSGTPAASPSMVGFDPVTYFMRESQTSREQFNQVVLALIARGGVAGGGGGSDIGKVLEVLGHQNEKLMELALSRGAPAAPASGTFDTVLKALEIGMETASNAKADSEGGWVSALRGLARDLAPVLSQMMDARLASVSPGARGAPALPAVAPAPAPAEVPKVLTFPASSVSGALKVPDDLRGGLLAQYGPLALAAAREGQTPIDFAGTLLDSVGVMYHPLFDSVLSEDLIAIQPELGQVRWLNPETRQDEGRWIDLVIDLLHRRDFGDDSEEGGEGA